MFGGNDGNNTRGPDRHCRLRPVYRGAAGGVGHQLPQAQLLPIQPSNTGTPYGLHPALDELQTLFSQGKMAVLANVGTLIAADHQGAVRCRRAAAVAVFAFRSAGAMAKLDFDHRVRNRLGRAHCRPDWLR